MHLDSNSCCMTDSVEMETSKHHRSLSTSRCRTKPTLTFILLFELSGQMPLDESGFSCKTRNVSFLQYAGIRCQCKHASQPWRKLQTRRQHERGSSALAAFKVAPVPPSPTRTSLNEGTPSGVCCPGKAYRHLQGNRIKSRSVLEGSIDRGKQVGRTAGGLAARCQILPFCARDDQLLLYTQDVRAQTCRLSVHFPSLRVLDVRVLE